MTDPLPRPVPRWLHVWAVLAACACVVLLAIGQLVTSFGAGMADRVWPTEPWYVFRTATDTEKARFKEEFAFFIEHTHRIAGWTIGGLSIILCAGLLWTEPRRAARFVAIAGMVVLIAGYGDFHKGMMAQKDTPTREVTLPAAPLRSVLTGAAVMLGSVASGFGLRARGTGIRLAGALALCAVMIQGLLGGFRVKLNELVGADLAAFHGMFAQVVFGLLVMIATYTARPAAVTGDPLEARRLRRAANLFAHLVFIQVVFGALVRHYPLPLTQRLHFLTAFLATAVAVWLLRAVFASPDARARAGWVAWSLSVLLTLQLYLGIEAWMAKFGAYMLPELVPVTPEGGAIRTLHALIGSGVWGVSLMLLIRLRSAGAPADTLDRTESAPAVASHEPVGAAK
jgi:heme A synthase